MRGSLCGSRLKVNSPMGRAPINLLTSHWLTRFRRWGRWGGGEGGELIASYVKVRNYPTADSCRMKIVEKVRLPSENLDPG